MKNDFLCARNFAIFGALLLIGLGTAFGPVVVEHAPWHVKIGLGLLFFLAITVYVKGYVDMRKLEREDKTKEIER